MSESQPVLKKPNAYEAASWATLAVVLVFTALACLMISSTQPMFRQLFEDLKAVNITVVTAMLVQSWVWWGLAGLGALGLAKEFVLPKKAALAVNIVHVAAIIIVYEMYRDAMYTPLIELMRGMAEIK